MLLSGAYIVHAILYIIIVSVGIHIGNRTQSSEWMLNVIRGHRRFYYYRHLDWPSVVTLKVVRTFLDERMKSYLDFHFHMA